MAFTFSCLDENYTKKLFLQQGKCLNLKKAVNHAKTQKKDLYNLRDSPNW